MKKTYLANFVVEGGPSWGGAAIYKSKRAAIRDTRKDAIKWLATDGRVDIAVWVDNGKPSRIPEEIVYCKTLYKTQTGRIVEKHLSF